jgi:hypothetical protein
VSAYETASLGVYFVCAQIDHFFSGNDDEMTKSFGEYRHKITKSREIFRVSSSRKRSVNHMLLLLAGGIQKKRKIKIAELCITQKRKEKYRVGGGRDERDWTKYIVPLEWGGGLYILYIVPPAIIER